MVNRYYVERVTNSTMPTGWQFELRDRVQGTNAEPMGYFADADVADKIAAMMNTVQVLPPKQMPALPIKAKRILVDA
jgi:hypothetical protein